MQFPRILCNTNPKEWKGFSVYKFAQKWLNFSMLYNKNNNPMTHTGPANYAINSKDKRYFKDWWWGETQPVNRTFFFQYMVYFKLLRTCSKYYYGFTSFPKEKTSQRIYSGN